ncbi:glycosyltransferase family 4 protein [Oscillatoria sp. FACHB-1407]|uniref:glycosyltransferase family 4 protein n=1 Tax=Oscillatoria sp. FACHB-1407 TaxID=2692847 RepID=UPI001684CB7D|nr:glycosyltransferase family 1 protein [Oscillatoria sp. FACHB-1407]MBD2462311.1 glycosyltransferase family 4 protein [Oscillatoria sp. FACHB-1407]
MSSDLPIHFFTIVLNGEPFIRYHLNIFQQLPFTWHWHIVEGVADLKHDTAWSVQLGGQVTSDIHQQGRSLDGTSEYLDEVAAQHPDRITVYRKPLGEFWDGKREMVNAPLVNIQEECLLWQVDVDELWTVEQLVTAHQMFATHPEKTAAFYWCWYFVGADLIISTRNCYAQNPEQDWLRTWRYRPGYVWAAHEPPQLAEPLPDGTWRDVAGVNPFRHAETEANGLIFQHFAYVLPAQLQFKERYYGYAGALSQWQTLQHETHFPVRLRRYFSWVHDLTMVDRAATKGVVPIAHPDPTGAWQFRSSDALHAEVKTPSSFTPLVAIDGVFFQLYKTGIARVWRSLLEEWVANGFANNLVVLDRAGTAPEIPGIHYYPIQPYNAKDSEGDRQMLQRVCDTLGVEVFISTYFTTPLSTPSVVLVYDMIPEVMGEGQTHPIVQAKQRAIAQATRHLAISQNTAEDVVRFSPQPLASPVEVAYCAVSKTFRPAGEAAIAQFRRKYGVNKPYFVVIGADNPSVYKNNQLFFQAFANLASKTGFDLVCTAFEPQLPDGWRASTTGVTVHLLRLTDAELAVAYSGAIALVYPSKYEGFGMPILEAMACGCPVITCPNSSIPEVAGEAALYVDDTDADALAEALCDVQKPKIRHALIESGLQRSHLFSWATMATIVQSVLMEVTLRDLPLRDTNILVLVDWQQPEDVLYEQLGEAIAALLTHPNQETMTFLIDISDLPEAIDVDFLLADVVVAIAMQYDLDIEEPGVAPLPYLTAPQWQVLTPRLSGFIQLGKVSSAIATQIEQSQLRQLALTQDLRY